MSNIGVPCLCFACTRLIEATEVTQFACTSYPDGIPYDIRYFSGDHLESRDGEPPFDLDEDRLDDLFPWLFGHPERFNDFPRSVQLQMDEWTTR